MQIRVKSEEDVLGVVKNGLLCRKRLKDQVQSLEQGGHLVFIFTIKESNEAFEQGRIRSKVYLVELVDTKDNYKEADYINLEATIKALNDNKEYSKENLLINTLQNLLKKDNGICLIGHIDDKNVEKVTQTLQFAERCNSKKTTKDLLLNDLEMINRNYKKEIEETETDYVNALNYLKKVCELNVNLIEIAKKGPSYAETIYLNNFKQAEERLDNYKIRKAKLEQKLLRAKQTVSKAQERINTKRDYFKELLAKLGAELEGLKKYFAKLKDEYEAIPEKMSHEIEIARLNKTEEITFKVKQKFNTLFSIHEVLESNNNEMLEATRLYQHCKTNLKEKYHGQTKKIREKTQKDHSKLISQYENALNTEKEELSAFMKQAKGSCIEDKMHVRQYKKEVVLLLNMMRKQERLINDIELKRHVNRMLSTTIPKSRKGSFMSKPSFYHNNRSISTSITKSRKAQCYSRPNTSLQYGY